MRRHLLQRFWARDGDPGPVAWAFATISFVLPFVGLATCLVGGVHVMRGASAGWTWLGVGATLIVLDVLIDYYWAHPSFLKSEQPHLNRPADQLTGRMGIVCEPIEAGRGKIRIGDTVWVAEGPDLAPGAAVRVCFAKATVLVVEGISSDPGGPAAIELTTSASTGRR